MARCHVLGTLRQESVVLAELALQGVVVTVSVEMVGEGDVVEAVEAVVEQPIVVQDGQRPPPLHLWSWYSSHVGHCFACESTLSRPTVLPKTFEHEKL